MDINISNTAFVCSHRISNPKSKNKSRPIIVEFVRYYDRTELFMNEKYVKGKGKPIT